MSAKIYQFPIMEYLPNRIRELRQAVMPKLSQQRLADLIGVSKVTISDLEIGRMNLTQDYMRRIAAVLDVAPADLLPRSENPTALSAAERELIERLRNADPAKRDEVKKVIDVMIPALPAQQEQRRA